MLEEFVKALAICHTITVEKETIRITQQSSTEVNIDPPS